jgi:hypothetical protein
MHADTYDSAGAGIEAKPLQHLRSIIIVIQIEKDLSRSYRNSVGVLADRFDIND